MSYDFEEGMLEIVEEDYKISTRVSEQPKPRMVDVISQADQRFFMMPSRDGNSVIALLCLPDTDCIPDDTTHLQFLGIDRIDMNNGTGSKVEYIAGYSNGIIDHSNMQITFQWGARDELPYPNQLGQIIKNGTGERKAKELPKSEALTQAMIAQLDIYRCNTYRQAGPGKELQIDLEYAGHIDLE